MRQSPDSPFGETYILQDRKPVRYEEPRKGWFQWFSEHREERRVALTEVGNATVSTVFLGTDYRLRDEGEPILFETLVTGGPLDERAVRCCTWAEAELQHRVICEIVKLMADRPTGRQ